MKRCPLCHSTDLKEIANSFYDCSQCRGIFRDSSDHLSPTDEKARYDTHNNDVNDEGYQNFVSPITNAILKDFTSHHKGLDFGAGPGPVISKMLNEQNYQIVQYDPFYAPKPELLKGTYDYIACCEVVEHFADPAREFALLNKLLKPGGRLYIMTDIYREQSPFLEWYYKDDPTHVFFYREETFRWLKEAYNFNLLRIEGRLVVLQ